MGLEWHAAQTRRLLMGGPAAERQQHLEAPHAHTPNELGQVVGYTTDDRYNLCLGAALWTFKP